MGATSRDVERGVVFPDWTFDIEFCRQQTYSQRTMIVLSIAIFLSHINHTRQTSAKSRWEIAFVKSYILDCIGIENRKHATHVVDIVQWYTIQENQILVGTATTHIETRLPLATRLHTGQEL